MTHKHPFVFLGILCCLSSYSNAQTAAGIIDPSRRIDWSSAGIPGGIPNRTTNCATIDATTYGNGSSDATSGIQAALNSCPSGQVVTLSSGTFLINTSLTIPSNKTLRGSGANMTRLDMRGSTTGAITFGSQAGPSTGTSNAITGGATQGSTSITVTGSGIAAGQMLMISGNNASYMSAAGNGG